MFYILREPLGKKSQRTSSLVFYGSTTLEQSHNLANLIIENCKKSIKNENITVHNYYICSANKCNSIDKADKEKMSKHKNFQHKWLLDPALGLCSCTGIWTLCYVDGIGMFCALCQMHNGMNPQSKSKIWNEEPSVRYRPDTIRGHLSNDGEESMHLISVEKEFNKYKSPFTKQKKENEKSLNRSYEKIFTSLYWLCKEEVAVSKAVSLFSLMEKLGVDDISSFKTRSPATIRKMVLLLGEIIKEKLVAKIKESHGYACLTDEVTDISNVENLLTFVRYYDVEKRTTATCFANTCDILSESDTTSADAKSIFMCLRNALQHELGLPICELVGFCSDGANVMTGKDNGVAARFKKLDECSSMLSVHCVCHRLALGCGDTADDLKFISDFEITMIQLWAFFKNSPQRLKIYIKTAMRLKEFENYSDERQHSLVKTVKKAVRTRWLSLDAGVEAVYKEYSYLLHALISMKDQGSRTGATAHGVLQKMDSTHFLSVLYILKFTLPLISTLSKTFQTGELNFSRIEPAIEKTIYRIEELVENQTPLQELKTDLTTRHALCEKSLSSNDEQKIQKNTKNVQIQSLKI